MPVQRVPHVDDPLVVGDERVARRVAGEGGAAGVEDEDIVGDDMGQSPLRAPHREVDLLAIPWREVHVEGADQLQGLPLDVHAMPDGHGDAGVQAKRLRADGRGCFVQRPLLRQRRHWGIPVRHPHDGAVVGERSGSGDLRVAVARGPQTFVPTFGDDDVAVEDDDVGRRRGCKCVVHVDDEPGVAGCLGVVDRVAEQTLTIEVGKQRAQRSARRSVVGHQDGDICRRVVQDTLQTQRELIQRAIHRDDDDARPRQGSDRVTGRHLPQPDRRGLPASCGGRCLNGRGRFVLHLGRVRQPFMLIVGRSEVEMAPSCRAPSPAAR